MRKLGKLLFTVGLIGTLAFGAVGCGNSNENNGTQETKNAGTQDNSASGEKTKVRIGCVGENDVLADALGIAQEKGY